jgi:plastocyanin
VEVSLREWSVGLSETRVAAGRVTFVAHNRGTVPHALEVEGRGIEEETRPIAPGDSAELTLTLKPGHYEVYCPVGDDAHKKLGMVAELNVTAAGASEHSTMHGYGMQMPATRVISVKGGGPVIQILPGPFPFADSARAEIATRPADQQADLTHKEENGPYSNNVAAIAGTLAFTAWDRGATGDSVSGEASFTTQDGARWRVVMNRVQTKDIPFNPRFGGVVMGLYYHGATNVHTPLVPTINSKVALWAVAHVYKNDQLVTDNALVHVMLLSRTRRDGDFALDCWNCVKNPVTELQLQVTTPPGEPKLDAPGGFLFVNWEESNGN